VASSEGVEHGELPPAPLEELSPILLAALALLWAAAAVLCFLGPSREYRLGLAAVLVAVGLATAAAKGARRRSIAQADWLLRREPPTATTTPGRPPFTRPQTRLAVATAIVVLVVWAALLARQVFAEVQVRSSGLPARAVVSSAPLEFPFSGDVCVYVYGRVTTGPPLCSRPVGSGVLRVGDEVGVHVDRHDPRAVVIDAGLPPGSDMAAVVVLGLLSVSLLALLLRRRSSGG
jgi:hypothetical protein